MQFHYAVRRPILTIAVIVAVISIISVGEVRAQCPLGWLPERWGAQRCEYSRPFPPWGPTTSSHGVGGGGGGGQDNGDHGQRRINML